MLRQAKPDPNRSGFFLPFCRNFARPFKPCPLRPRKANPVPARLTLRFANKFARLLLHKSLLLRQAKPDPNRSGFFCPFAGMLQGLSSLALYGGRQIYAKQLLQWTKCVRLLNFKESTKFFVFVVVSKDARFVKCVE